VHSPQFLYPFSLTAQLYKVQVLLGRASFAQKVDPLMEIHPLQVFGYQEHVEQSNPQAEISDSIYSPSVIIYTVIINTVKIYSIWGMLSSSFYLLSGRKRPGKHLFPIW